MLSPVRGSFVNDPTNEFSERWLVRQFPEFEQILTLYRAGVRVSQTTGAASRVFLQFLSASVEHAKGFVLLDSKKENVDHLHALVHRHAWSYEVNIVGNSFARVLGAGLRRNASKPDLDVCGR